MFFIVEKEVTDGGAKIKEIEAQAAADDVAFAEMVASLNPDATQSPFCADPEVEAKFN